MWVIFSHFGIYVISSEAWFMLLRGGNGVATLWTLSCPWAFQVVCWVNMLLCNSQSSHYGITVVSLYGSFLIFDSE